MRKTLVGFCLLIAVLLVYFCWARPVKEKQVASAVKSQKTASYSMVYKETFVEEAKLPMALPTNPEAVEKLKKEYGDDNYETRLGFFLEINAHLNRCAGGKVPKGVFYYWIHWQASEDGTSFVLKNIEDASGNPNAPNEGLSEKDKELVLSCVKGFMASYQLRFPGMTSQLDADSEMSWAIPARFPVSESRIYSLL